MDKRRFLPARRFLHEYITDEFNDENEENQSHLNAKRYFLQSKRYFLNSKRNNERREEVKYRFSVRKKLIHSYYLFFQD
jgi:hypothetical protein